MRAVDNTIRLLVFLREPENIIITTFDCRPVRWAGNAKTHRTLQLSVGTSTKTGCHRIGFREFRRRSFDTGWPQERSHDLIHSGTMQLYAKAIGNRKKKKNVFIMPTRRLTLRIIQESK